MHLMGQHRLRLRSGRKWPIANIARVTGHQFGLCGQSLAHKLHVLLLEARYQLDRERAAEGIAGERGSVSGEGAQWRGALGASRRRQAPRRRVLAPSTWRWRRVLAFRLRRRHGHNTFFALLLLSRDPVGLQERLQLQVQLLFLLLLL